MDPPLILGSSIREAVATAYHTHQRDYQYAENAFKQHCFKISETKHDPFFETQGAPLKIVGTPWFWVLPTFCETQQSFVDLLTSPILTFRLVVSMVTSPFISIVWCFRPYKLYIFWKLIIWRWVNDRTNTYKKKNTKTKTPIYRQRQIQSASKTQCMLHL